MNSAKMSSIKISRVVAATINPEELFERWVEPQQMKARSIHKQLFVRQNGMRNLCLPLLRVIDNPFLYRPPTPPLGHTRKPQARVAAIF